MESYLSPSGLVLSGLQTQASELPGRVWDFCSGRDGGCGSVLLISGTLAFGLLFGASSGFLFHSKKRPEFLLSTDLGIKPLPHLMPLWPLPLLLPSPPSHSPLAIPAVGLLPQHPSIMGGNLSPSHFWLLQSRPCYWHH